MHLAHAPEWATIISRAYKHAPLNLEAQDDAGRRGRLPAVVVRRPFGGTVVSSMPFLDGGGPSCSSPDLSRRLVDALIEEARRLNARVVDVRCADPLELPAPPSLHKVNMTLDLPADDDELWRRLDKSVRNQVRKAERAGLTAEPGHTETLDAFYAIYAARMRDLGSPAHDRAFFRAVLDCFGARGWIVLVRKGSTPIGGLLAIGFHDALVVPWAACLKEHFALCPNMLLYWSTLKAGCTGGYRRFDFGRSTRESGTYRFKRQWGASETPLFWYTIPIRQRRPARMSPTSGAGTHLVRLWQQLPLAVTRRLGPHVRKYLIQ
jgi:FemAB-related protein (PEP-CTERM system-associated)